MTSIKIFAVLKVINFMPKGQKISKNLKQPLYSIVLLLVQFILIKIGTLPIILIQFIIKIIYFLIKKIVSIKVPSINFKIPK